MSAIYRFVNWRTAIAVSALSTILCISIAGPAYSTEAFTPAATIEELESRLDIILEETEVPGLIGTIVYGDEIIWLGALGLADRESGRPVTNSTLFRVGSISKSFTALAILKLVERGELSLDDLVRDVAPEAGIVNPWSETDPIMLAHVLEHTAGFDDIHFRDYSRHDPSASTLDGILYNNGSRTARWRPGTRMSYSNIGPPIAALALENVTGRTIEEFIQTEIFDPLGMNTATYFQHENVAASYRSDGLPSPYVSITLRASGSLNASSLDMAQALKMFNGRGQTGDVRIVTEDSLARMERPRTTLAARQGLQVGYGLGNYVTLSEGFVFQGHNGGIDGFSSNYGYLPDAGRAYFFSINRSSGQAYQRISRELNAFVTRDLMPPEPQAIVQVPEAELVGHAGLYEPNSPRQQILAGFESLRFIRISQHENHLLVKPFAAAQAATYPVGNGLFIREGAALPTSVFARSADGETLFLQGQGAAKKISPLVAYGRLAVIAYGAFMAIGLLLFSGYWILRKLGSWQRPIPYLRVRVLPALGLLLLGVFALAVFFSLDSNSIERLNVWTASLWLSSMLFPIAALIALITVGAHFNSRHQVGVKTWHFCLHASMGLMVFALFLLSWGYFGIQTWAY